MFRKLIGAVVGLALAGMVTAAQGATLFGTSNGSLWTVDASTGSTTLVGNTPAKDTLMN